MLHHHCFDIKPQMGGCTKKYFLTIASNHFHYFSQLFVIKLLLNELQVFRQDLINCKIFSIYTVDFFFVNFTCVRRVQGTIAVHVKCKKKSRDCIILVTYLHDFSPNFHESCACTHSTSLRSVRSRSFAIWTMDKDSIKKCLQN